MQKCLEFPAVFCELFEILCLLYSQHVWGLNADTGTQRPFSEAAIVLIKVGGCASSPALGEAGFTIVQESFSVLSVMKERSVRMFNACLNHEH